MNHINNLKRAAGQQTHSDSRYQFLYTTDDVINALRESHDTLSYALRKEAKRDRFISNSQGLVQEIRNAAIKDISKNSNELYHTLYNDAFWSVQQAINDICSGASTPHYSKNKYEVFGNSLGNYVGNKLSQLIFDIYDELDDEKNP